MADCISMTADTPLYCECGKRLGLRRSDGAYVSTRGGRTVTVSYYDADTDTAIMNTSVTCEKCSRVTEVDNLLDAKVG